MPQAFNIQSSIQITIDRKMATTTIENPNIKRHVLDVSAPMTSFSCRFPLANLIDALASLIRYPFQDLKKAIEGKISDLPTPKFLHGGNVQRLEIHGVKPIAQRVSQLKEPIGFTVGNSFVCFAQSMLCFLAVVAAFLLCCQFSVALGNFRHASLKELRTMNSSAIAASEECFEPKIKPCRVNGTSGLNLRIFLFATEHHPKTIHTVTLQRASFDLAFDFKSLNELVLILPEADSVFTEVRPASLLEDNAPMSSRSLELGLASLQSSLILDPLEKCLIRQVKFFDNSLNTLRTNNLPVLMAVSNLGNVLHQLKLVAVPLEQPVVCLLKSYAMVPDTSSRSHEAMKPVIFSALVHPEFVADSHLGISLIFNVLLNDRKRSATHRGDEIAICPKRWQATLKVLKFCPKRSTASALYLLDESMDSVLRITLNKKVHMIGHCFKFNYLTKTLATNLANNLIESQINRINDYTSPVLRAPNHMILTRIADVVVGFVFHRLNYTARRCIANAYFKNIRSVGLYPHA